jgi:hypothetical protein
MDSARVNTSGQKQGKLIVQGLASCAVAEISGLVRYRDCPDRAMRDFYLQSKFEHAVIMIFNGVVRNTVGTGDRDDEWCNGCQYCQQFAAYILRHKLGEVKEGVEVENRNYHTGHFIRIYTWSPDYQALEKWYKEVGSKVPESPKRVVLQQGGYQ